MVNAFEEPSNLDPSLDRSLEDIIQNTPETPPEEQ